MAIVNTFPKCLDSPYLFVDPEAPGRVARLLEQANERLDAARAIQSNRAADSAEIALFCYEASFACLRALVYHKGFREGGLRCLMLACEHLYVRPGLLDVGFIHDFERAQGIKLPPGEALAAAGRFHARTLELLHPAAATA